MRHASLAAMVWLGLCVAAAAQTAPADRPGPYIIDVRGTMMSLPNDATFFPPLPSSTAVPSRGFGIDLGAHVYPLQLGPARLGIGAAFLRARGTVSTGTPDADSGSTTGETTPEVAALLTTFTPQVSFNFGSRAGWSYLSAGFGRAQISTRASAFVDQGDEDEVNPARVVDHDSASSLNFGGGARWFVRSHLAFTFDVRFHMIGAGGGEVATPSVTEVAVSVGLSFR
jgi:Outer membrane protein beta-barrel domain